MKLSRARSTRAASSLRGWGLSASSSCGSRFGCIGDPPPGAGPGGARPSPGRFRVHPLRDEAGEIRPPLAERPGARVERASSGLESPPRRGWDRRYSASLSRCADAAKQAWVRSTMTGDSSGRSCGPPWRSRSAIAAAAAAIKNVAALGERPESSGSEAPARESSLANLRRQRRCRLSAGVEPTKYSKAKRRAADGLAAGPRGRARRANQPARRSYPLRRRHSRLHRADGSPSDRRRRQSTRACR